MCQSHPIVMNFLLKKYLKFAKKEENSHESRRKLTLKTTFFKKNFKINDHKSMVIYVSILLKKGNKITILSWIFLWKLSKKRRKKSCDKCVFAIFFFIVFEKYGNENSVNLQHLVSKNCLKITILSCVFC